MTILSALVWIFDSTAAVSLLGWGLAAAAVPVAERVTICELVRSPEKYSGQQVSVHARIVNPQRMVLEDGDCGRVLLVFPADQQVRPKAKFRLLEDDNFKRLMEVAIPVQAEQDSGVKANSIPG